jgi:RimJ/RimL family protein N-acetyltransferase
MAAARERSCAQNRGRLLAPTEPEAGTITLPAGTRVPYRPIRPADLRALQRFHGRLSGSSIYQRFFSVHPVLSDTLARYFTELDGQNRFALVALDPARDSEIIAVVRFDREAGTTKAEYAAIVVDAWQGKGLGTQLTIQLIEAAKARGITALYALVLPENRRMLNLLRDLRLPETTHFEDGVERVDVSLITPPESAAG